MTDPRRPLPRVSSLLGNPVPEPVALPASPAPLWQVTYRLYDCEAVHTILVHAVSEQDARQLLTESLHPIGCQIKEVTPMAALAASDPIPGQNPPPLLRARVRGRTTYQATRFQHLGDHPAVRLEATPRTLEAPHYSVGSADRRHALKPGWWVLEKDGEIIGTLPPASFQERFEPAETMADAGVRAEVEALCRSIENEPFALQEPGSSEKRGRLQVLERLHEILAKYK